MNQHLLYDDFFFFINNVSWNGIFSIVLFRDEIDMDTRSFEIFMPVIFSFHRSTTGGVPGTLCCQLRRRGSGIRDGKYFMLQWLWPVVVV